MRKTTKSPGEDTAQAQEAGVAKSVTQPTPSGVSLEPWLDYLGGVFCVFAQDQLAQIVVCHVF